MNEWEKFFQRLLFLVRNPVGFAKRLREMLKYVPQNNVVTQVISKQDTLCVLPFIHFNLLPNGQASVCCVSTDPLFDENNLQLNVRTHTLQAIWQSKTLRDVRTQMLASERPSQCLTCYKYEDSSGFSSHRMQQNSLFLNDNLPIDNVENFPQISRDKLKPTMIKPWYFDLRFDNLCNLKCVICSGSSSSRIENDPIHSAWTGEQSIERNPNRFGMEKWVQSNILFEELVEMGSDVRFIQLAGGEPFMSELSLKWLKYLCNIQGKLKN